MKAPWLAALLNIVPIPGGLGYLYLGRPGRFRLAFFGAIAAAVVALGFLALSISDTVSHEPWGRDAIGGLAALASWFVMVGITAWDSYRIASRGSPGIFPHGLTGKGRLAATVLAIVLVTAIAGVAD